MYAYTQFTHLADDLIQCSFYIALFRRWMNLVDRMRRLLEIYVWSLKQRSELRSIVIEIAAAIVGGKRSAI